MNANTHVKGNIKDMAGNTLGARRYYAYTSDTGTQYSYLTDQNLGEAMGAVENDTLPGFPRRFKPRGVYVEGDVEGDFIRKFVICPLTTTAAYAATGSTQVTIDEATLKTTGRRGERQSFGSNPVADDQ